MRFFPLAAVCLVTTGCGLSINAVKSSTLGTDFPDRLIECRQLDKKITFYGTGNALATGLAGSSGLAAGVVSKNSHAYAYIAAGTSAVALFFHFLSERNTNRFSERSCNKILSNDTLLIEWSNATKSGRLLDWKKEFPTSAPAGSVDHDSTTSNKPPQLQD